MKRELRNRRSDSSCSSYHHSNSVGHLQPYDLQTKQKKVQCKVSDIEVLLSSIYESMRQYQDVAKGQIYVVKQWKKNIKTAIGYLRHFNRINEQSIYNLKAKLAIIQQSKSVQIRNLRVSQEEQLKQLQRQNSKNLSNLSNEFSKKQQNYKELISKFMQTLQVSQKNWTRIQDQLHRKIRQAEDLLKHRLQIDSKNYSVYQQVAMLTQQISHKRDDSLRSINLSHDQIAHQIPKLCSRRNTIDISSIGQFEQAEDGPACYQNGFQDCLIRMICWGFFVQKNQTNIKKIIEIMKNLEDPQSIRKQPIFPIIIQSIKLLLDLDKQPNMCYDYNSDISCDNADHIVMRDIDNQKIII